MNLPNRLTATRLCLAPVFFIWYFAADLFAGLSSVLYSVVLVLVYGVMELTDLLDGKIARKRNLVTDLGKVLDPFGDVISHLTFFTCFLVSGLMPVWAFIIILWREFSQSFMRMLLMGKGTSMAANIFGKAKTCLYAFCTVCSIAVHVGGLFCVLPGYVYLILDILFAFAAFSSLVSFIIYIYRVSRAGTLKDMTR